MAKFPMFSCGYGGAWQQDAAAFAGDQDLPLDEAGCLRLEQFLLILPPETYLREDPLRIVDRGLDEIAQIGEAIQVTGAEKNTDDYRYFHNKVCCSGPYWGVNQISATE